MKPIKMFGLAALATLTAMAFVSASSAVAENTQLCTTDPGASACGSAATHIHEVSVGKGKILMGSPVTAECDVLFLSTSVGALGAPQQIEGNFTYTNCGSCSVTEENGPALVVVLRLGHEAAHIGLIFLIHVNCSGANCRVQQPEETLLLGSGKGPLLSTSSNGEASFIQAELEKESGLLCPSTIRLDLTTTPLSATYIGS